MNMIQNAKDQVLDLTVSRPRQRAFCPRTRP